MQINSASIDFSQQHKLERNEQQRVIGQAIQLSSPAEGDRRTPTNTEAAVSVDLSTASISINQFMARIEALERREIKVSDIETSLLKALVEAMTGEKVNTAGDDDQQSNSVTPAPSTTTNTPNTPSVTTTGATTSASENSTPVLLARVDNRYSEYEYSNVSINADLTDSEGLSFSISLNVTMERRFESRETLTVSQAQLQDPLVINFNGATARLSNELVEFDLDSDGIAEQLPSLVSDSAYIALDKNGDGIINNGTELFGASSGQGFLELAAFDEDGNGFIDSNDRIFSQLVAFNMGDGTSQPLSELGVGALATSSIDSPFRLTDRQNNTLGVIRSTGFYLDNQRQAGSLQQVDLVV